MAIPFPGHSAAAASTEVPLEMLAACHRRIEHQCATLERMQKHVAVHGSDEQARGAALRVMRYFDTAAQDHHEDEEMDLFPALLESVAGSDAVCIRDLVDRLGAEHRLLEMHWRKLRKDLERIAAGEHVVLHEESVSTFVQAYRRHIELEETELLPLAHRLLDRPAIDRLGEAMRQRRGITLPPEAP